MLVTLLYPLLPQTANAGLFSFISDIGGDQVSAKNIEPSNALNSQNMLLLEAPINSDPNPYKGDTQILAYGNALSAEIGPQGTASDVDNKVSSKISLYTVHDGDTISKVAKVFGVSANTVIWANELNKNSTLKEGQLLVILPISGIRYTVTKGDTIKGIVSRYNSDLKEVLDSNDLTLSSVLRPGSTIIIPDAEPTVVVPKKITAKTKSVGTNPAHDTNGPYYPGYYIRPIDGGYMSQGLHGYNAIDLAAPIGTIIRASASGKVITSLSNGSWNGGYGNMIIIAHDNDTQTLYAHNSRNFVKVGDIVEQGEMIGRVGHSGKATGDHLHFEIRGARQVITK